MITLKCMKRHVTNDIRKFLLIIYKKKLVNKKQKMTNEINDGCFWRKNDKIITFANFMLHI